MYTKVRFLKPFVFCAEIGGVVYNLNITFEPNSSLGVCYGYIDATLLAALPAGLVEAV